MSPRNTSRKKRELRTPCRKPELGYYFIITDTEKTEACYLTGVRNSIPKELQDKLVIKVKHARTKDLVDEALNQASLHPVYGQIWIVLDRDKVKNFDDIIRRAEKKGIRVGWSNPCIETWLNAYYGSMPVCDGEVASVACCERFEKEFEKHTNQKYDKADERIYQKLKSTGDEAKAIRIAEERLEKQKRDGVKIPSKMLYTTRLHELVREIREKV